MPTTTTHPDPPALAAFERGGLPPGERAAVAEHVAVCGACRAALGSAPGETLDCAPASAAGASLPSFPLPIPDCEPIPAELVDHPRYKVLGELGAGGMGVVYKAEHTMMGRVVALKVMAPHLTARASVVDRFHREVKAAAKLMHPNIVTAHDADSAGGLHFLVMEYVDGVSLDRLVRRRGPLAVTVAAQLARQVALGLQHAHEKDMVHRDIKPQNLMVSRKGQVKILDFGLARFARDAEADGVKPQVTAANLLMGTPEYLSPEQAKNSHNVDSRSDIYSLGCTLYFLLTARVPFPDATTVIDKLLAHTREEPTAIRSIRPEVPDGLAAVVAKMMAKTPDDRYRTPAAAAAALLPFTKEADPAAPPPVPVVTTVGAENLFELDSVPEGRAATRAGLSTGVKRLIGVGVAAVMLLVVAGIAGPGKKSHTAATDGDKAAKGTPSPLPAPVTPPAKKKKVLLVVSHAGVWADDYQPVRDELEATGAQVVVGSSQLGRAKPLRAGKAAEPVLIDVELTPSLDLSEYAAVIFCGGHPEEFGGFRVSALAARHVVERMSMDAKPVGAIGTGIVVLASKGFLSHRNVAASDVVPRDKYPLVRWQSDGVVRDGAFITAAGPPDARPFAQAVLKATGPK